MNALVSRIGEPWRHHEDSNHDNPEAKRPNPEAKRPNPEAKRPNPE